MSLTTLYLLGAAMALELCGRGSSQQVRKRVPYCCKLLPGSMGSDFLLHRPRKVL